MFCFALVSFAFLRSSILDNNECFLINETDLHDVSDFPWTRFSSCLFFESRPSSPISVLNDLVEKAQLSLGVLISEPVRCDLSFSFLSFGLFLSFEASYFISSFHLCVCLSFHCRPFSFVSLPFSCTVSLLIRSSVQSDFEAEHIDFFQSLRAMNIHIIPRANLGVDIILDERTCICFHRLSALVSVVPAAITQMINAFAELSLKFRHCIVIIYEPQTTNDSWRLFSSREAFLARLKLYASCSFKFPMAVSFLIAVGFNQLHSIILSVIKQVASHADLWNRVRLLSSCIPFSLRASFYTDWSAFIICLFFYPMFALFCSHFRRGPLDNGCSKRNNYMNNF